MKLIVAIAYKWQFYFRGNAPFEKQVFSLETPFGSGGSRGILEAGVANKKGQFKYGISLTETNSKEDVADEDPLIIVH